MSSRRFKSTRVKSTHNAFQAQDSDPTLEAREILDSIAQVDALERREILSDFTTRELLDELNERLERRGPGKTTPKKGGGGTRCFNCGRPLTPGVRVSCTFRYSGMCLSGRLTRDAHLVPLLYLGNPFRSAALRLLSDTISAVDITCFPACTNSQASNYYYYPNTPVVLPPIVVNHKHNRIHGTHDGLASQEAHLHIQLELRSPSRQPCPFARRIPDSPSTHPYRHRFSCKVGRIAPSQSWFDPSESSCCAQVLPHGNRRHHKEPGNTLRKWLYACSPIPTVLFPLRIGQHN